MILEDTYIDEGIGFGEDNQGLPEIKYTQNPEYYTDMYKAGQTKQQLKIGQEVEGEVQSGSGGVKTLNFSLSSIGVGNHTFSGFGFKPTSYTVNSGTTGGSQSMGCYDGTTESSLYSNSYAGYDTGIAGRVIHLRDGAGIKTYGSHDSFTSDGIVIDFSNFDINCTVTITAYK